MIQKRTVNLLGDVVEEGTEIEEPETELLDPELGVLEGDDSEAAPWVQYLKPELYLYMVPETTVYSYKGMPDQFKHLLKINDEMNFYEPVFELTDFWVYKDILVELNSTVDEANVTMHIQPYSFWKVAMFGQYEQSMNMYKDMGIDQDRDMTIKMLTETNFYLLVLTMVVSVGHTICEFMAFKNEIHFWKDRDTMTGISVRTLYINLGMSIVIFLYLLDSEDTSMMIWVPAGLGIAIEVWKIMRASKVTKEDQEKIENDEQSHTGLRTKETDEYDKTAMKYLSYVAYPLVICYAIYSLIYDEHKGWYSFIIGSLVGAVYVFGFITMTPQLYINYKLKSVEHLPWRALIYRFLNTIIDDLFSFIISMPTMHRVACFRDDIIFLVYLYQRWIYRVDKKRDPYGAFVEDEMKQENEKVQSRGLEVEDGKGDEVDDNGVVKKEDSGVRQRKKESKLKPEATQETEAPSTQDKKDD